MKTLRAYIKAFNSVMIDTEKITTEKVQKPNIIELENGKSGG